MESQNDKLRECLDSFLEKFGEILLNKRTPQIKKQARKDLLEGLLMFNFKNVNDSTLTITGVYSKLESEITRQLKELE